MPHLRSVDKGMFPLLIEGVTSPMRANLLLKSLKFRSFAPWAPHHGVALDPLGALRGAPNPMPVKKKSTPPPTRIPGSAPGPFLGHHYYILSISNPYPGVETIFKEKHKLYTFYPYLPLGW